MAIITESQNQLAIMNAKGLALIACAFQGKFTLLYSFTVCGLNILGIGRAFAGSTSSGLVTSERKKAV